jgi:cytochrome c-type biogenesis protein CcmE
MTRKHQRLVGLLLAGATLGVAATLVFRALDDTLVFFYSPSQAAEREFRSGEAIRLGGLVKAESVEHSADSLDVRFIVTDGASEIFVTFNGILPDLFRDGQGVVAEGSFLPDGTFAATEVLARHDENYMPKEVMDALREQGMLVEENGEKSY